MEEFLAESRNFAEILAYFDLFLLELKSNLS